MPSMTRRLALAAPFALASLLALPARSFAQGAGEAEAEAKAAEPIPKAPVVDAPPPEVKGNRYQITLKSGAKIEGLLPQGVAWEKRDQLGEYVEAAETEKGAGLRLNYVLNMEGDIFIQKKDISEVKDLGALTDEQKLAIKEAVLKARKKILEEREKINREELARIAAASKEADAKGAKGAGETKKATEEEKKAAKEEKDRKRGDELLKKFPSDEWSPKTIEEIKQRSVINGIYPTADEQEFIDNIALWKEAVARRDKEAAEKEAGDEGTGEEKKPEGDGKDVPPEGEKDKKGKDKYKVPPAEFKKKGE